MKVRLLDNIKLSLLVLCSLSVYLGSASYLALLVLASINFMTNKYNLDRYLVVFLLVLLYAFLLFLFLVEYPKEQFDYSVFNVFIQVLTMLSFISNYANYIIIRKSLFIQIVLSIALSVYGIVSGNTSMFINAAATKGFSDILIPLGIYSTPQVFASVILFYVFTSKALIDRALSISMLVFIMNRTSIIIYFIVSSLRSFKSSLFVFTLCLVGSIYIFTYSIGSFQYTNIGTILSRLNLISGVLGEIDLNSIQVWMFGSWSKVEFYLPMYDVTKNYVENGFLFIFKYFGVVGLLLYLVSGCIVTKRLLDKNYTSLFILFILYYFGTQNMTHEFLTVTFYQIMVLVRSAPNKRLSDA